MFLVFIVFMFVMMFGLGIVLIVVQYLKDKKTAEKIERLIDELGDDIDKKNDYKIKKELYNLVKSIKTPEVRKDADDALNILYGKC